MFEYEKLAKSYGIKVDIGKGLQIISIPTESNARVDIGFTSGERNIIEKYFPCFQKYKIYRNLSVYGDCAKPLSQVLADDYIFCSNLCVIFDYAYSALWSGREFTIRINALSQGYPQEDGTGGERLFASLKNLADRLNAIDPVKLHGLINGRGEWGPIRIRKIILISAAALPVVLALLIRFVLPKLVSHH